MTPNSHPYSTVNPLSPIEEAMTPSSLPAASPFSNSSEYRVGRGPFPPPVPKTNVPYSTPTIEDIRRATIKFNLPEEGVSSRVNISDCVDGVKVMEKVLKKFNKLANTPRAEGDADYLNIDDASGLVVDGWGVFLPSNNWDNPDGNYVFALRLSQDSLFRSATTHGGRAT
jgi:mitogen-activated protein kinase kinase kinase